MKCGIGICGSCCISGDLVCRDGTVFDGNNLMQNNEFGQFHRAKSGILGKYDMQASKTFKINNSSTSLSE